MTLRELALSLAIPSLDSRLLQRRARNLDDDQIIEIGALLKLSYSYSPRAYTEHRS